MVRFIFICIVFIAISFTAIPALMNISKQRDVLLSIDEPDSSVLVSSELSFEEIYALADANLADANETIDPALLNAIAPAAGDNTAVENEGFSSGFSGKEDSALAP